jgi:hypothetical protein
MADFNQPTTSSAYADFLSDLKGRDVDAITLCLNDPTNIVAGSIKFVRSPYKFQERSGGAWVDRLLSLAGGGTAAATAADARTNLGLGSMATQDNSAVNITGGTIAGCNIAASQINSGTIAQARLGSGSGGAGLKALFDDQTYKVVAESSFDVSALQSADFTATITEKPTVYLLTGTHTVSLPTVIGIDGGRVCLVNVGTGAWTVDPNGAQTINGAATFSFDFGQYSSITLVADANNTRWLVF